MIGRVIRMLAISLVCSGVALAAQPVGTAKSRMDAQAVAALALQEIRHLGLDARFRAEPPDFHADRKVWWVMFSRSRPPYFEGGNVMLVVVEDGSGKVCVQQGPAPGPCT